jgi:segregation and condensation protein B
MTDPISDDRATIAQTVVASLTAAVDPQHLRMAEALLFAAVEPLDDATLAKRLPDGVAVQAVLAALQADYQGRGIVLGKVAGRWAFHTAPDLAYLLEDRRHLQRKLSRAAVETLAIVAYHQPVTRAEIEEVRGVSLSKGTLDVLIEAGWVKPSGRRRTVGKPLQYRTTEDFLIHFGLNALDDLPGIADLKAAGLLEAQPTTTLFAAREDANLVEDPFGEGDDGSAEFLEPLVLEPEESPLKPANDTGTA